MIEYKLRDGGKKRLNGMISTVKRGYQFPEIVNSIPKQCGYTQVKGLTPLFSNA